MDSKHDNHKKLRPLEDGPLSPELQWENMEAGIFQKMEELQAANTVDDQKRHRRAFLFFLLFLGILIPTLLFINQGPASQKSVAEPTQRILPDGTAADTKMSVAEEGSQASAAHTFDEEATANSTNTQELAPLHYEQQNQAVATSSANYFDSESAQSALTVGNNSTPASLMQTSIPASRSTALEASLVVEEEVLPAATNEEQSQGIENDLLVPVNLPKTSDVSPLTPSHILYPVVSQASRQAVELPAATLPTPLSDTDKEARLSQLWLTGGASWWDPDYGNTKPERDEFETSILSYQAQLNYVYPLRNDWFVMAGIQYQKLENRFDWNAIEDGVQIVLEDTIIQIQQNAITGAQTEIRGDVTLTVSPEREVRHFNSFTLLQVPVAVGKSWGEKKWKTHLMVGAVANLSFSRMGRTLFANKVVDFDNDRPNIWSDKLGFNAMLGTGLSYQLTDRLGVMTVFQYQRSLGNWSAEEGITMRPHILNWSFGANYSL